MTTTQDLDLTTLSPSEIDTLLFPLWADRWKNATRAHEYLLLLVGAGIWPKVAERYYGQRYGAAAYNVNRYWEEAQALTAKKEAVEAEIAPLDAEHQRRGGWTRYRIVNSKGKLGHLHYGWCSSFRQTTETFLVAEASGLTADEVVGVFGETACTKCFKNAPVAR